MTVGYYLSVRIITMKKLIAWKDMFIAKRKMGIQDVIKILEKIKETWYVPKWTRLSLAGNSFPFPSILHFCKYLQRRYIKFLF